MHDDIDIRELTEDDWELRRHLRLAALADSPSQYMGDYASSAARDETQWRAWMAGGVVYAAFLANDAVALVGGHRPDHLDGHVEVVAMWVAPAARGRRIAGALLDQIIAWAEAIGAPGVYLEHTVNNESAHTAYLRHGFVPTNDIAGMPGAIVMRRAPRRKGRDIDSGNVRQPNTVDTWMSEIAEG